MEALSERGLRVPEDYSLCGLDDMFPSSLPGVRLTTIDRHPIEIGASSLDLLWQRITSPALPTLTHVTRVEYLSTLIDRGSCASPRTRTQNRAGRRMNRGTQIMDTIKINSGKTLMVAHRGMSGIEKENTFAAFVAAGNRNHYGIETDVHVTVDGKFVCIHDDTTGRVAIDNLVVEESTFDTLRNLLLTDVDGKKGRTDLRIPTLQEYIQICKKYGKVAVLELKNHFTPENVMRIVDVIKGEGYLEHVIFISFDYENMLTIRRLLPDQPAQFLTKEIDDALIEKLEKDHLDLDVKHVALTKEMIETLHAHNIVVNCWTVDDPARAEELVSWGVDYITSNILQAGGAR